jgi:hypothetical protein
VGLVHVPGRADDELEGMGIPAAQCISSPGFVAQCCSLAALLAVGSDVAEPGTVGTSLALAGGLLPPHAAKTTPSAHAAASAIDERATERWASIMAIRYPRSEPLPGRPKRFAAAVVDEWIHVGGGCRLLHAAKRGCTAEPLFAFRCHALSTSRLEPLERRGAAQGDPIMRKLLSKLVLVLGIVAVPTAAYAATHLAAGCPCGASCPCGADCPCSH